MRQRLLYLLLIVAGPLFISCASIHTNQFAKSVAKDSLAPKIDGFLISGELDLGLSTEYFGMLHFNFENKSDDWIRIKNIIVSFQDQKTDENVLITGGPDITEWTEAMKSKVAIDSYNRQTLQFIVASMGQALLESDDEATQVVGGAMLLGAAASITADRIESDLNSIQRSEIFPENHLLANEFAIPPGLFTRKWILLNTNDDTPLLSSIFIEIILDDGRRDKFELKFREPNYLYSGDDWQRKKFDKVHHIDTSTEFDEEW